MEWLTATPCKDIFQLILNPQDAYKEAINELAVVPVTAGRFQISKEAYINTLDVPLPDSLYRACRDSRKIPFTNIATLFSVYGNQVVLNQDEAGKLIDSQSIYASGDKIQLIADLRKLVALLNNVNSRLNVTGYELFNTSSPHSYNFFHNWCTFEGGDARGSNMTVVLSPEFIRNLAQ